MGITYTIDRERGRITTRCVGNATLREVLGHFDELELDSDRPERLDVLLDLSEMTSLPNVGQIRTAAERAGDASRRLSFGSCAIVVASAALFGMARVFETLTEAYFSRTAVFRDREAAEDWLASAKEH